MATTRFFFIDPEQMKHSEPAIAGSDVRHIRKVLRLQSGDRIGLFDGRGGEFEAKIRGLFSDRVTVEILETKPVYETEGAEIGVAQAFLKDRKMDGLIRQLTELGISEWIPFVSERSVSRPEENRLEHRIERWQKITREAVKQCRRSTIPRIHGAMDWDGLFDEARKWDLKYLFWEQAETPFTEPNGAEGDGPGFKRVLLVLGPEGGFSETEAIRAGEKGFKLVSLGPRILRAESATVAAGTLAQYLYGDLRRGNR